MKLDSARSCIFSHDNHQGGTTWVRARARARDRDILLDIEIFGARARVYPHADFTVFGLVKRA